MGPAVSPTWLSICFLVLLKIGSQTASTEACLLSSHKARNSRTVHTRWLPAAQTTSHLGPANFIILIAFLVEQLYVYASRPLAFTWRECQCDHGETCQSVSHPHALYECVCVCATERLNPAKKRTQSHLQCLTDISRISRWQNTRDASMNREILGCYPVDNADTDICLFVNFMCQRNKETSL